MNRLDWYMFTKGYQTTNKSSSARDTKAKTMQCPVCCGNGSIINTGLLGGFKMCWGCRGCGKVNWPNRGGK